MATFLSRVGGFCVRFRWPVLALWLIMGVGLLLFTSSLGATTNNDVSLPGTGSQKATDRLTKYFSPQQNGSSPAVYHVTTGKLDDKGKNQNAITAVYKQLKKDSRVSSVTNPFKNEPAAGLVSEDGQYAWMPILLKKSSSDLSMDEATEIYDIATKGPESAGIESAVGGPVGSTLFSPDTAASEKLGMIAAAVILLLAFGSVIAMGMPLISAVVGLLLGFSFIWFLGVFLTIPSIATTLAEMIGLGVGIDYALFMTYRHRRNVIEKGMHPHLAATHAVGTSGGAIIFAGGTVIIALLSLQVAGIPFISGLGYACAAAVATAVLAALTLLPALLAVVGKGINRVRIPLVGRTTEHPIASRWAGVVTKHPIICAVAAVALLAPLIVPIFSLVLGQEDSAASPKTTSQRRSFDLLTNGFGAGFNGPLAVVVAMNPVATPSKKYDNQYAQATQLQTELEQEQSYLTAQQQELEQQQATLEQQGDELQAEATQLEAEQATLESEASQLQRQQSQLQKQGEQLKAQGERLAQRARDLLQKERRLLKKLRKDRRLARVLERRIDKARDPVIKAELEQKLKDIQKQRKQLRKELKDNTTELQSLRKQAENLRKQIGVLEQQAVELAKQGSQLAEEAKVLEAEGSDLQAQEDSLNAQAASLQEWGDELQQESDQAQQQEKQANQLQKQLTKELTKAGGDPRGTDPKIIQLQDALGQPGDVQLVEPPMINKSGNTVILSVIADTRPADPKTADLVTTLRDKTIPPALSPGMEAYVGGSTASNVDLASLITAKLPLVILTIIALSSVLMMLAFRSLLIPLEAAISNMLAAAASFGVVTAVFQWGWGLEAIGLNTPYGTVPVISYVPLMMFAALFGLSTDYQVFLLSTVQGASDGGVEPREAVREGLTRSAKIIVTAALIMMSVFGSFVVNDDSVVKEFGVGLTVAVALAASLVLLLAPALLTLFNHATWDEEAAAAAAAAGPESADQQDTPTSPQGGAEGV